MNSINESSTKSIDFLLSKNIPGFVMTNFLHFSLFSGEMLDSFINSHRRIDKVPIKVFLYGLLPK